MRACLAEGFPFVFGFTVYESFESQQVARTGVVEMPGRGERVMGGHAVLAVGYRDSEKRFTVRNSWGAGWAMKGYFTMPYDYLPNPNLAEDFWTIRRGEKM
jgi:C1A family cysteine protease